MLRITALLAYSFLFGLYDGVVNLPNSQQRIVGGIEIDIGEHPYQVTLRYYGIHHCGGSIIGKNWIATAAHCVQTSGEHLSVGAGNENRLKAKVYNVSKAVRHPKYRMFGNDYDIALVQIDGRFQANVNVQPIKLPERQLNSEDVVNVTGWGAVSEGGGDTDNLMRVTLSIVDRDLCTLAYSDINVITERMICAGEFKNGGKDSCQGDSGGPLSANGTLYGIVSWGYGCARPNYPGVYTNVAYFRSWIADTTGI